MNPLLKLACLADLTNILKIVDVALIVLLIVVLGVLVLAFLRGLLRGWKYGTYRLIFFAILVTIVLSTLPLQAKAIGGVDLSGLHLPDLNFTITIDGEEQSISVTWTTLQSSLEDLIIQIAAAYGASSYSGIISYASVMATSLIKLLLIFAWGLILTTLGLLLIMLLWHLIFKRFTPIDRRKIKKLRIVSAFEEVLIGAACMGMLLTPFTSIANSLNSNFKVEDEDAKQNETVSMITDILGVYDQSAFAKTFFSWNSMDGSTTFDQQLISFLTQSEVGQIKTDLVSEISSLASLSSDVINAGLLDAEGSEGIRWYFLLSCSSIPEIIMEMANTTLIQVALPFAVSLAVNLDAVKDVLGEETCKYLSQTQVNWKEVLESMSRIYQDILDAGIIKCVANVDEGSPTPSFEWSNLKYVFSGKDVDGKDRNVKETMHALTAEFEDSELFSHLMAGLLSQLGKAELEKEDRGDLSILDFLPMKDEKTIDYEALVDLNYTKEFNLLYDTIYSINEVSPSVVDQVLDFVENPPSEEEESKKYRALLSEAALHSKEYVELIVGERDSSGNPKKDSKDCLLDSSFIGNALPSLVSFMEKAGGAVLDMELSFEETKKELKTLDDYKREFGAALDVAADFASSEEGAAFLKDGTGMVFDPEDKSLISIDPKLVKALQGSLDKVDDSMLLKEALPQVAEHYFESFSETLSEYGIEQVNFHCENLGHELSNLLDLISYSGDLLLAVNRIGGASSYLVTSMVIEESDSLLNILDVFASSAILNPVIEGKSNVNFASLLNYVFSSAGLEDFKIEADALDDIVLASERDAEGNVTVSHENAAILKVLIDLAKSVPLSELLALGSASQTEMMKTLAKADIRTMFKNIGNSKVMSSVAGSAMDKYLGSALDFDEGSGISFKNVTDWEKEGEIIGKIVDLATNGIDISNFDMDSISPSLVKNLFASLAQSAIFNKQEGGVVTYKFPEFFSSKVLGMLDDSSIAYFTDQGRSVPSGASLEVKKENCSLFVENCLALDEASDWTDETNGEISLFAKILGDVQSLGGFSSFTSFSRGSLPTLRSLLESLASSNAFGQVLLANALSESLSSLPTSSSLDLSLANPDVFFDSEYASAAKRKTEVNLLCDVIDTLFDPNYGLLDEKGNFLDEKMSIQSLSVDYCLRPLLEDISASAILNTPKEGNDETLLKSLFKTVLVKINLYGEGLKKDTPIFADAPKVTISSIVDGVKDMEKEITSFCDAVKIVQDSGLLSGDSLSLSSLDASAVSAVTSLLEAINSSEMLYRSLPLQLDKAIRNLSLPATFKEDLNLCDPFVMRVTDANGDLDYAPYEETEIACIASLLSTASEFSSLDSASFSDLADLDPSKILSPLYASRVFNSTINNEDGAKKGFTSAQAFVADILAQTGLDDLICSSSSPKDDHYKTTTSEAKYRYLVSSTLGLGDNGNYLKYGLEDQQKSGNAFYEILGQGKGGFAKLLSNLSEHSLISLLDGGSIDFASLSGSTLSSLLKDLCRCALLSDVPVNALAKYLSSGDLSVKGINLSLTNYYYPYSYSDEGTALSESDESRFSRTYGENEIDLLVDLLDLIDLNKGSLSSGKVGDLDPYLLRQMLLEFGDSLLFHQTGAYKGSASYGIGWSSSGGYSSSVSGAEVTSDLTVFEQMMYLVYDTSGLADRSFAEYHDFSYLQQAYGDADLAAKLKLHAKIKAMDGSSWAEEISAITTNDAGTAGLIQVAKSMGMLTSDGSSVNMSNDFMKTLAPGKAMKLLRSLSGSKICGDAFATTISSFLTTGEEGSSETGLGVGSFSEYTATLSGTSATFTSEDAFLEQGIAYDYVSFYSPSYDGSEKYTFKADVTGDGSYSYDLASYANYSSNTWVFATSKVGCNFKITLPSEGEVSYKFNAANYYLEEGNEKEKESTLEALDLFLCSLYKDDGTYYAFGGGSSALEEAYESIELYGLSAILMKSGFYAGSYFNSEFIPAPSLEAGGFSASSYALYQVFSVSPSGSGVSVRLLDAIDEPYLKDAYGSSIPLTARLCSIEALIANSDPYAEGEFLKKSLKGISLSEGVHLSVESALALPSAEAQTSGYRLAMGTLAAHSSFTGGEKENGDYYEDFLNASLVPYSFKIKDGCGNERFESKILSDSPKSVFAEQLIASALKKRAKERLDYAKLTDRSLGGVPLLSPTEPTRARIGFLSSGDQGVLFSFASSYGYKGSSGSYDFSDLSELVEAEKQALRFEEYCAKGISFAGSKAASIFLSDQEKSDFDALCLKLDGLSGKAKAFMNLAYVSDAYDLLVLKGNTTSVYFYHGSSALSNATDFPSTYEDGVLDGVSTPFSYQNVSKAQMSA